MVTDGKQVAEIKDFKENHSETTVSFTIMADEEKIDSFEADKKGLSGKFKLTTALSYSNMNLFATDGRITKYGTPEDILDAFCEIRQEFYDRRKEMLVFKLRREQRILSNKARFVVEVCNGELIVSNRKRTELLNELNERGYETFLKRLRESKLTPTQTKMRRRLVIPIAILLKVTTFFSA